MVQVRYKVVESFDPQKDYGVNITRQVSQCLQILKKGQEFEPKEITMQCQYDQTLMRNPNFMRAKCIVSEAMTMGTKIGLLDSVKLVPMTSNEFLQLETVQYFKDQLRGFKQNHMESTNQGTLGGTQKLYLNRIWFFSNWLSGREFEITRMHQVDLDMFKKTKEKVILQHVEHLLKLYQESEAAESDVIKIIKRFLMDDSIHLGKRASTVTILRSVIKSYFKKNDSPIDFDFNPKTKYKETTEEELDQFKLTLDDLFKMLTVGRPSIMEKAIVLCKFHRGLDNSTLSDRFNFQACPQLVNYFGTSQFENWDLDKCPVPIKLTRIKTSYTHRGFLDRDAIVALQDWLKIRYKKTGKVMNDEEPIFLNTLHKGITDQWVNVLFVKLSKRAGLHEFIQSYSLMRRSKKTVHELRDLLKSTLIACDVADYVCELAIGHKVGDSYSKQDKLFPEKTRQEFAKASKKLNIFSNFTHSVSNFDDVDSLKQQISELRDENEKFKLELLRHLKIEYRQKL